jgi:GAF domain-containing protein
VVVAAEKLTALLKTFARTLVTDYPFEQSLESFCTDIVEILDADGAGIMLEDEAGKLRFVSASDELIGRIEELQVEFDEGPCQAAYASGEPTLIQDLDTETRFPQFSPPARAAGIRSVQSFPLRTDGQCIGALNLYATRPIELSDDDVETGQVLADVASTYIINSRNLSESVKVAGQLQQALDSRVVIEQAKGRLSEQLAVPVTESFEIMRRYARNNGLKLRAVAADVVAGDLKLQPSSEGRSADTEQAG